MKYNFLFLKLLSVLVLMLLSQVILADASATKPLGGHSDLQLNSLNQLEWERRLILVKTENVEKIKPIFLKHEEAINERNISWFIISEDQLLSNYSPIADEKLIVELQSILSYFPQDTFILIGYDGEIKSTDNGLNIAIIFEQIDRMPMRQIEMSRQ